MITPDRLLAQQQIYNFLRTVTIKFEPLAQYINTTLLQRGFNVNVHDKSSWKYYRNMIGEYHGSDRLMYVTSVDTHETILFSKDTLVDHPRTRAAYVPGGIYYNRICEFYPDQVDLIKSILFPVESMEKALRSEDLTMLAYGDKYLEEHEHSVMIMKLEEFLEVVKERWYFNFLDDEPYFHITFWSCLTVQLAGLLMAARIEHIRTPYVHSFELWSALRAEGLDDYSDILDRKKSMMLYQNIAYFKANAGRQSNMDILAERLLRDLGIGLYNRIVVQESETKAADYQLTPQLMSVRLPVISDQPYTPLDTKTVAEVQSEILEKGLTDNDDAETVETVERKLGDTRLNEYATKFMEIRPLSQNRPYAELLNTFLLETLLVSISQGYYTKPVEIREPLTHESIFLSPKELIALYNYAVHKSMGQEVETIPSSFLCYHAFDPVVGVPEKIIPWMGARLYLSQVVNAQEYLSGFEYDTQIANPAEFSEMVTRQWLRWMDHHLLDQGTILEKNRHAYAYLSSLCHTRREEAITLVTGYTDYTTWLGASGIDLSTGIFPQYDLQSDPKVQWANLADTIIASLIPANEILSSFGNFTLSNSGYDRLRQLFVQMCSYRVVFLQADREMSEHVGYGKWSTVYGPDNTNLYADFIVATSVNSKNVAIANGEQTFLPGVSTQHSTNTESNRGYSVTTTVVAQGDNVHSASDRILPMSFGIGTTTARGVLSLPRSSPRPIFSDPVS